MHDDVDDVTSEWFLHQFGNVVQAFESSCWVPDVISGFISGADFRDGGVRHEAGDINSHGEQYLWVNGDPNFT